MAAAACGIPQAVHDGGKSVSIRTATKANSATFGLEDVQCLLAAVEAPHYVQEHIGSTRALDGPQEEQWNGLTGRWTYHPDNGLAITLVDDQAVPVADVPRRDATGTHIYRGDSGGFLMRAAAAGLG